MTSIVKFPVLVNGREVMKEVRRIKANDFTQMVVYKTKLPNGKFISSTRHEIVN